MPKTSHFRRILRLSKVLHISSKSPTSKKLGKNDAEKFILPLAELIYAFAFFASAYKSADLITLFGGTSTLLPSLFLAAGIISIFFSLIELISTLYFSSDLSLVATLPFSSVEIVLARLIGSLYTIIPLAALFIFPISLGYGLAAGLGIFYYATAILGFLLVVPFSILLSAILAMLLMSFVRIFKNKDFLSIFSTILVLAIVFFIISLDNGSDAELEEAIFSRLGTFSSFSWLIPIAPLLTRFYETGNILFFLAVLLVLATVYGIFYLLASNLYLKSALSPLSSSARKKSQKKSKSSQKKQSTISSSLLKKEFRTVFRTPAYFMNGCLGSFIWPILIFLPILANLSGSSDLYSNLTEAINSVENISEIFPYAISVTLMASFGITFFSTMMNNLAYTSLTREGSSFYLMKTLPVPYRTQLNTKLRLSILISAIGSTPLILVVSIIAASLGILPPYAIILALIINLSSLYLFSSLQLFLGTRHPNLSWTNIAIASKDTSLLFIFVGLFSIIALISLSIVGMMDVSPLLIILVYSILLPILSYFLGRLFIKNSVKNLKNLEI